jgi:hypothetical protein
VQRPVAVGVPAEEAADGEVPVRDGAAGDDDEAATAVVGRVVPVPVPVRAVVPVPVRASGEDACVGTLLRAPAAAVGPAAVTEPRKEQPASASSRRRPSALGDRAVRDVEVATLPR